MTLFALAAVVGGGVSWLVWPKASTPTVTSAPRDVSTNYSVCFLPAQDQQSGALNDAVWIGLQRAAAGGRVNAQRYPVPSAEARAASPYINGAVGRHCDAVVVASRAFLPSVREIAGKNTRQRFLVVGTILDLPNVTSIPATDLAAVPDAVSLDVTRLARQ